MSSIRKQRHMARHLAVQALYAWNMTGTTLSDIMATVLTEHDVNLPVDSTYFKQLVSGVSQHLGVLDDYITPFVSRPMSSITPIEQAILRIGAYELLYCDDLDYKIALNEAIELAKVFGAVDSHKFINGVLDKVAKKVRADRI